MKFRLIESIDNKGNELSSSQTTFFKNSKVVDDNGNLLVCYRGTKNKANRTAFRGFIKWFTTSEEYANKYNVDNDGNKTYACYLNCDNIFDCGVTDGYLFGLNPVIRHLSPSAKQLFDKLNVNEEQFNELFKDELQNQATSQTMHIYTIVRTDKFGELVKQAGYDAIRTVEEKTNVCYGVFYDEDIKSVDNLNPTNSTNMNN